MDSGYLEKIGRIHPKGELHLSWCLCILSCSAGGILSNGGYPLRCGHRPREVRACLQRAKSGNAPLTCAPCAWHRRRHFAGSRMKKMFLGVLAPLCDRQQFVDTVSAAPLEPTRSARSYRCAPPGVHFHALHLHFPCVFAHSRYECMDHCSRREKKKKAPSDVHPRRVRRRRRHLQLVGCRSAYVSASRHGIFAGRGAESEGQHG